MAYNVIISNRAHEEIEHVIDFYAQTSKSAPSKFISELQVAFKSLEINPFFCIRYKNIRSLRLKKFPYSLFFLVNEENMTVSILACFHDKIDPKKRPKEKN